ncbi:MAG: DEAD/DEAH box helicase, partial [Myxococcales bacterium]|nr:DEAD/DEAH box helicase [Myxococcales bacterium]
VIRIQATDEASRDLVWFLERYPMRVRDTEELDRRARAFDQRLDTAWQILQGTYESPTFALALPPRPYQVQAATLAWATGALLLADDLGLGKTVTALTLLSRPEVLPAVVVVPAHLPRQWKREVKRFLPGARVHVAKTRTAYPLADDDGRLPDVLIVSEAKITGWADYIAGHFRTLIIDECQMLRRPGSDRYRACQHVAQLAAIRLGLSGTPIYNYGYEFWAVFDVLAPGRLGSSEEFLREWCIREADRQKAKLRDPKAFGAYLRDHGLMLRRTRAEVGEQLPPVTTYVQEIDADTTALDSLGADAAELARIVLAQGGRGVDKMQAAAELSARMRQATGIAKAPFVAAFVRMLLEQDIPVVLFGWHREVYRIWEDALGDFKPAWYTGTENVSKKVGEVDRFLEGRTNLLIMSLRSGAGVDGLQARAATVVFGELDWSPGVHEQNVGRLFRSGQSSPVFTYYLVADHGADPTMVDVLGLKRGQLEGVRDPEGAMIERLEADPEHIKRLAEDYLRRRGTQPHET